MAETEIRSVLVPVTGGDLLLPNATVAEIVDYSEPESIADSPRWLLGNVLWRGWQVPVISFSTMAGVAESESVAGARFCITKCLIDSDRLPYLALLTQGYPRLVTVTETALTEVPEDDLPAAVAGRIIISGREARVPDLDQMAELVLQAAYGRPSKTSS